MKFLILSYPLLKWRFECFLHWTQRETSRLNQDVLIFVFLDGRHLRSTLRSYIALCFYNNVLQTSFLDTQGSLDTNHVRSCRSKLGRTWITHNFTLRIKQENTAMVSRKPVFIETCGIEEVYEVRSKHMRMSFYKRSDSNAFWPCRHFVLVSYDGRTVETLDAGLSNILCAPSASNLAFFGSPINCSHFSFITLSALQSCSCAFFDLETSFSSHHTL